MDWSTFSIGNAAGFVKGSGPAFDDLLRSPVTEITVGSITVEERAGNPGNTYWYNRKTGSSINSLGLPNPGIEKFLGMVGQMAVRTRDAGKRLRVSIAGFSVADYRQLAEALAMRVDTVEVNLGCPNVWGDGGQKPIASFNPILIKEIVVSVLLKTWGSGSRVAFKLSPIADPMQLEDVANTLRKIEIRDTHIDEAVTSNTFPNGLEFKDDGERAIDMPYGGVAGEPMRTIALGQVAQFAQIFKGSDIPIVGVGGVSSGKDVIAMHRAGASGIQIGTAYAERRAKVFQDVLQEAGELVG